MEKLEKYILLVSFITSFSTLFLLNSTALAMPSIGTEYMMNNVTQNWALTMVSIFISASTIPAGQICSKYGCKKVFVAGCLIFLVGLIVSCISISSEMFVISRAIQGIGYAFYLVAETAIIVLAIDKENRGKSLGIVIVGSYVGSITAPLLGGYLITHFGWRLIFYIMIPLVLFCALLTILKVNEEWTTNKDDKMDIIGGSLYVIGIILFVYGFSDLLSLTGELSVIIGIVILIILGIYESKIKLPVFKIKMFKNKIFAAYNLTGFFCFFAIAVFDVLFNYYFQYAKGWDPQITGLILIVPPIILAVISPNSGRLSDKIHPQKLSTLGLGVILIPLVALIFVDANTSVYAVIIAMALIAVGTGLFSVPNTNAVMSSIPEEQAPYASATQITLRSCGQTMSLGLLTLICTFIMGSLPLSHEYADLFVNSFNMIALICAALCIIAIAFSIWGIRLSAHHE